MRNTPQVSAPSALVLIPDSTFSLSHHVPSTAKPWTPHGGAGPTPSSSEIWGRAAPPGPRPGSPHCVVLWSFGVRQERRCPVKIQQKNMGHPAGRSGCVLRPPWVKMRACAMPTQGKSRDVCRGPAPVPSALLLHHLPVFVWPHTLCWPSDS